MRGVGSSNCHYPSAYSSTAPVSAKAPAATVLYRFEAGPNKESDAKSVILSRSCRFGAVEALVSTVRTSFDQSKYLRKPFDLFLDLK